MNEQKTEPLKHKGRIAQTGIYFRKFLRMFVYQSDWKVLPIGAVIAAIVTFVIGENLFVTQEGTQLGTFALVCVCIWNGFFNSIQVVCRERDIVKREHRAGLHISSYICSHLLYQLILCILQTIVTIVILMIAGVKIPMQGVITPLGLIDIGLTILLITYVSDIMALMVSCIVRTTTTAMTVMPFLLIFQLVFSGGFFQLSGVADYVKYATISHWGMNSLSAIGRYNEQPMVSLWNTLVGVKNIEIYGQKPLLDILVDIESHGMVDDFIKWSGQYGVSSEYASTVSNVLTCWGVLLLLLVIFALASVIALKFVDRDKR
ncbi:MAG: ABC transporter permease [Lachnospiraceae bacterium]|nr:ABC transporter permease [Lachnospiraceae bacterium]